jgi:predicted O-methyltransferase YrrM
MGSKISNIVQLGHHAGYSKLLIGFMLYEMNLKDSFVSIDIYKKSCDYIQKWIERAGLSEYIRILQGDSADPKFVDIIQKHFNGRIKFIIIDSSHQY